MLILLDLPPVWSALALAYVLLVNHYWPNPSTKAVIKPWLGYGFMLYAVFVAIWAAWQFNTAHTPIEPRKKPKTFIRSGPYRYSRNPIYTAMILFIFGVCLLQGAILGYVAPFVLFFILKERFVKPEEIVLQNQFGEDAVTYLDEVNRW